MGISFQELFNLDDIQRLQNEFAEATGVASLITLPDGTPITQPSNFTNLCNNIIRKTELGCKNCHKSDAAIGRLNPDGPIIQPCMSGGLWDAGAGISVRGTHIANWLIGQVRDETQTNEKMRQYAREIGANEDQLLEAFDDVPSMSIEQFSKISQVLFTLAQQLSEQAYQNLEKENIIQAKKETEKELALHRDHLQQLVDEQTEELKKAVKEAKNANLAKSQFISSMSHELRTPLNAVMGFSQLLNSDPKAPLLENQREKVDYIIRAGDHLLELINQVLDLAKIEAGELSLSIETVNIKEIIEECVSFASVLAETFDVTLINEIRNDIPPLMTDFLRTKQILLNLISNACKYNNANGKVILRSENLQNGFLRIMVRDTGNGIPIEKQNQLFKPFQRLGAEFSSTEGTGIGLTLTKELVESLGGEIGFKSNEGDGSLFWVDLPFADETKNSKENELELSIPSLHKQLQLIEREHTLLYIEDNPINLTLMKNIISSINNLKFLHAFDGELGLIAAQQKIPDVIVLDIHLPDMNGEEVMKWLTSNPITQHIPVIALTADAMTDTVSRRKKMAFSDYLTKPIHLPSFMNALSKALIK